MKRIRHISQDSRESYRRGCVWRNVLLEQMYRPHKSPLCNSLTNAPDLLIQPIFPVFAYSRRSSRRRKSLPFVLERSNSKKQTKTGVRCSCRSTNVNFVGWQRHRSQRKQNEAQQWTPRARNPSKTRMSIVHRRSKVAHLIDLVQNALEDNPKARPSICSFITGLIVIIQGLISFTVPVLRSCIPPSVRIALICAGAIAMFIGAAGIAIYLLKNSSTKKSEAENKELKRVFDERETSFRKCTANGREREKNIEKLKYDIEGKVWNGNNENNRIEHACIKAENCEYDFIPNETETKPRRKLPHPPKYADYKSPLSLQALSSYQSDGQRNGLKYIDEENGITCESAYPIHDSEEVKTSCISPQFPCAVSLSDYYSSEPDLAQSKKSFHKAREIYEEKQRKKETINNDDVFLEPTHSHKNTFEQTCPPAVEIECLQHPFNPLKASRRIHERTLHSIKHVTGKELFDTYQDPLLHRAITRLKFQCDREFRQIQNRGTQKVNHTVF